jgi:SAM-dependent methyltransferase
MMKSILRSTRLAKRAFTAARPSRVAARVFSTNTKMDASIDSASDVNTEVLYDAQADNWVREKPNCLSDFTGRPVVFNFCGDVQGKKVIDIGCGEGYCARELKKRGAGRIVAMDVSPEMAKAGTRTEEKLKQGGLTYFSGDATKLHAELAAQPDSVVTQAEVDSGFDLAISVFVFNYVDAAEMELIMGEAYKSLRPGGSFVFSVPHPLMAAGATASKEGDTFHFGGDEYTGYFSSRGKSLPGVIGTRDGKELNVRMNHKTFADYVKALGNVGFQLQDLHECAVTPEHRAEDYKFFGPLEDKPLHAVFKAVKPTSEYRPLSLVV